VTDRREGFDLSPSSRLPTDEGAIRRELGRQVTLVELLDRILDQGVAISGEVTLAVADVDLVRVGLRALIASVDRLATLKPARS
jgi:gas vesicle protein GvpA/GvpJ/GvpM family